MRGFDSCQGGTNLTGAMPGRRRDAAKIRKGHTVPRERIHHGSMFVQTPKPEGWQDSNTPGEYESRRYEPGEKLSSSDRLIEESSLDVHWQRDMWVQISLDIPRDKWIERAKEVESDKERISTAMYTETLTRDEINKMIRTLRKARDQAFGADE